MAHASHCGSRTAVRGAYRPDCPLELVETPLLYRGRTADVPAASHQARLYSARYSPEERCDPWGMKIGPGPFEQQRPLRAGSLASRHAWISWFSGTFWANEVARAAGWRSSSPLSTAAVGGSLDNEPVRAWTFETSTNESPVQYPRPDHTRLYERALPVTSSIIGAE